jgi:hypothetical protein
MAPCELFEPDDRVFAMFRFFYADWMCNGWYFNRSFAAAQKSDQIQWISLARHTAVHERNTPDPPALNPDEPFSRGQTP